MSYTPNKNKIGDVYLAIYRRGLDGMKMAHYSIIIDTAGESTNKMIVGRELHLGVDRKTRKTSFTENKRVKTKKDFKKIIKIGKIKESSDYWEDELCIKGKKWYDEFVEQNGREEIWSAKVNCQQYIKFLIRKLGLIPPDVPYVGDKFSIMIDAIIMGISVYNGGLF